MAEILDRAKAAGLGPFARTETAHFAGVGDAPGAFRAEVVAASERAAKDFVDHFREKGFADTALPTRRMTVVILADARSYRAFTGQKDDLAVGGHYEIDTNRLVMFDFRADQGRVNAAAEWINTLTLIHETTHILTFNTGILDRKADVPLAISEGLATYGEVWRPNGKGRIGGVNLPRLSGLGRDWLALSRLLVEDGLLEAEGTRDAAYAQAWVLIHAHLKSPARLPRLRSYLAAIRGRTDPKHRLDDARGHLGDLEKLDVDLRRYASRLS